MERGDLTSVIRRQFRRTGFDLRRLDSQASLDLFLARLCRDLRISCVVDVGANEGQFARSLRLAGFSGRIISFEPSPGAFTKLKARAASDADWDPYQVALGSKTHHLELKVLTDTALSSFLEPDRDALAAWGSRADVEQSLEVPVRRLDEVLPEVAPAGVFARSFLKIDTQGWDSEVLSGSEHIIEHVLALQTELSFKALYKHQPPYREALLQLESMGFEVAALFPVVRDRNYGLIEADCVMVRQQRHLTP
jgi:FkbM family methyltransferase